MVTLSLHRVDAAGADRAALIDFLSGNEYPFHMRRTLSRDEAAHDIDEGAYEDDEHASFWLRTAAGDTVGLVRLEDLQDPTPLFDLRLAGAQRGRGLGHRALAAITEHVFTTMPEVTRFEGQTREDNIAMRRIFLRAGWLKEAHYRESWPVPGGAPLASVAYAILRRDWETGTTTPFVWEDIAL